MFHHTVLLFFYPRYFIFTSFWAYKIYYVYGFMLLVVLILIVVTVCVTIVCTYFLLNAEDYRWYLSYIHHFPNIDMKQKSKERFFFVGNGQAFFLQHQHLAMFSYTQFTTSSLKLSEYQMNTLILSPKLFIYSFSYRMYGLFQTAFYFGYMALFSLALGLLCGTVGYIGSSLFVRKIYSTVKID